MEVIQLNKRADGVIRATDGQKQAVLDLLINGHSMSEVARAHGLAIQTLVKWRRGDVKRVMSLQKSPTTSPVSDDRKEILSEMRRLAEENQKLRKALGNVSYDRDILQEAYNIAVKKKWI